MKLKYKTLGMTLLAGLLLSLSSLAGESVESEGIAVAWRSTTTGKPRTATITTVQLKEIKKLCARGIDSSKALESVIADAAYGATLAKR